MARASTPTLLPLDTYAKIMGVSPPHFNGAVGEKIFSAAGGCTDVWYQYAWQGNDRISREELAETIAEAEQDIHDVLGFWPAPKWISEVHKFPRHHRPNVRNGVFNDRYLRKSIILKNGKLISPGPRAESVIGTATTAGGTLVFSDEDGDGYSETATITLATTVTDQKEIRCYYPGETDDAWEIRPARSITIAGGNVVIVFWAWQLIDEKYSEAFPGSDEAGTLDISDAIYLESVDVRRVYTDNTGTGVVFYWEAANDLASGAICSSCGGAGCPECTLTTQNGCLVVRDVENGIAVPTPATYSADDGEWSAAAFSVCREPDQVKVYYYAGDMDQRYIDDKTTDPMPKKWARIIAYLATARLERPLCSCGNTEALYRKLRAETAFNSGDGSSWFLSDEMMSNPFGTRYGEVWAYRRLMGLAPKRMTGVAV